MNSVTTTVSSPRPGVYLGRPFRLPLYLGWSFLVVGLVLISGAWLLQARPGNQDLPALAIQIWLGIALVGMLQEAGHAVACRLLGGKMLAAMLSGYGGIGAYKTLSGPRQAATALAGPLCSSVVSILLAAVTAKGNLELAGRLLNPFWPPEMVGRFELQSLATVFIWVACSLSLIQLLPMWQCSGRAILDGLVSTAWPHESQNSKAIYVAQCTTLVAVLTMLCAVVGANYESLEGGIPKWPFVTIIGAMIWLSGRRTDPRVGVLDPRQKRLGLRSWWKIRRAQNQEIREASDAEELDLILEQLHQEGFDSLSLGQKSVLKRVSRHLQEDRD